jgi:polar amino acid transport system substrate-binding protein
MRFAMPLAVALLCAGCVSAPSQYDSAAALAPPVATAVAKSQLAPGGKLRVALLELPTYITPGTSGEMRGVAVDMARAMAAALGVSFEPMTYGNVAKIIGEAPSGVWDIAFLGADPSRAAVMDFSDVYLHSENAFLVRHASPYRSIADLDVASVRVAVVGRSVQDVYLRSFLKAARSEVTDTNVVAVEAVRSGRAEAVAAGRLFLEEAAAKDAGLRVLEGNFQPSPIVIGVPKGRADGAAYATEFVRYAKRSGLLQRAVEDAKLRGVSVPQ